MGDKEPEQPVGLTIVGLGPGDPGQMSRAAWEVIQAAPSILLRTRIHPTVPFLEANGVVIESCDRFYESGESFEKTYDAIAQYVIDRTASGESLIFGVPGHPLLGERTVDLIRRRAPADLVIRLLPSPGFLDVVLAAADLSISDGAILLDALAPQIPPAGIPAIYYQVYDTFVASDLKLCLLERYAPESPVTYVRAAGTADEEVRVTPLYQLDRLQFDHLTSVVVPAAPAKLGDTLLSGYAGGDPTTGDEDVVDHGESLFEGPDPLAEKFLQLVSLMETLRSPNGCPWDIKQTHESLRRYVLEEAYEVVDCIDRGELRDLPDELGDLLLQVLFHAQIAQESGGFSIEDVLDALSGKLIRRHPHVFGDVSVSGSAEVIRNWEAIKEQEKLQRGELNSRPESTPDQPFDSAIDGVALALPAMTRSYKIFQKAASVGFDWSEAEGPLDKVAEELDEIRAEMKSGTPEALASEVGDLILAAVNVARKLGVNPEEAARTAIARFSARFRAMELAAARDGRALQTMSAADLDDFWEMAKGLE